MVVFRTIDLARLSEGTIGEEAWEVKEMGDNPNWIDELAERILQARRIILQRADGEQWSHTMTVKDRQELSIAIKKNIAKSE